MARTKSIPTEQPIATPAELVPATPTAENTGTTEDLVTAVAPEFQATEAPAVITPAITIPDVAIVAPVKAVKITPAPAEEISEAVTKILKLYSDTKSLYIDAKGGTFPADTNQSLVGRAILYQNPFYNK